MIGSLSYVAAYGTTSSTMPDYAPVKFTNDLMISAVRNGGQIDVKYSSNLTLNDQEFKYWKLMGASDANVPVYPDQSAIKVWTDMSDTRHSEWKDGARYYRICLITKRYSSHPNYADWYHGRYCSNVVSVAATNGTTSTSTPTTVTPKPVSAALKTQIDLAVEKMVTRLQVSKTDDEVISTLQSIVRQLKVIANEKPAIAYVADYVVIKVQEQIDLLSLGDIMNLLN